MSPLVAPRQACPRCRRLLPPPVAGTDCPSCRLDDLDDVHGCTCRVPVPLRLYLGHHWLCALCCRLIEKCEIVRPAWGPDRCDRAAAPNGTVFRDGGR
jgi:hypothetical protein